ncbi:hypothetical protein IHE55_26760 [Streptomyces pactum]|uniref:Uncharacterized protein n=1 Tax=Streptomyces pactum TaxID=68249 RepID=A0ABS0NSS2_9ACTN|nr:hypothetical protein [Streptomyces pactum]MBH5338191.1 hypothetical protein [Streptomyces pactum]
MLAATPVTVLTGAAAGPLADAAARALRAAGATVSRAGSRDLPAGAVLLRTGAAGRRLAVAAGESRDGGYVTAPGGPAQAGADAAALAARLGAGPPAAPAPATTALLAGAAAQRLLCAAGGLPDPAGEGDDPRLLPGLPAVLVATARPPRADYRSWLGPDRLDADRRARLGPAGGLATALARTAALTDERTGALPAPAPGTLCQLPVPLAACPLPGTTVLAGAPRTDLARLDAFCRACEVRLGPGAVVGASPATPAAARCAGPPPGTPPAAGPVPRCRPPTGTATRRPATGGPRSPYGWVYRPGWRSSGRVRRGCTSPPSTTPRSPRPPPRRRCAGRRPRR